jgi:AraC family transcriptional regulator
MVRRSKSTQEDADEEATANDSTLPEKASGEWVGPVIALLDAAIAQLHSREHGGLHQTLHYAASLLRSQLDSAAPLPHADGQLLAWQARRVRAYIDTHIASALPVADLAALVQRSEAHFSRAFRKTFGESPHAFVLRRRLELAALLMLQTDTALSDIALRCGFSDQAHFSRRFRQANGQAPSVWRRTHRGQGV